MKYNYQLDPTISEVINNQKYEEQGELLFQHPTNILSQQKSDITTNPYIKVGNTKNEKTIELNINNTKKNPKFAEINENLSYNVLGFFDDLFLKPSNEAWNDYIPMILSKDDRYNYLGVFLLLVAFFILLVK